MGIKQAVQWTSVTSDKMAVISGLVDHVGVSVGADFVAVLAANALRGQVAGLHVVHDPLPRHTPRE